MIVCINASNHEALRAYLSWETQVLRQEIFPWFFDGIWRGNTNKPLPIDKLNTNRDSIML